MASAVCALAPRVYLSKESARGRVFAEKVVFNLSEPALLPHESLSDREYQNLCIDQRRKTASEIAAELALSGKSVGTYRDRILQKLNLKRTRDLIRYAINRAS